MRKQITDLQPAVFEEGDLIRRFIDNNVNLCGQISDKDIHYFIPVRKPDGIDYCMSVDSFVEFIKNKIKMEKKL